MQQKDSWSIQLSNQEFKNQFDKIIERSSKNNISSCIFCGSIPEYDEIESPLIAVGLTDKEIMFVIEARAKIGKENLSKDQNNKILIVSHDFDTKNIDPRFKIAKIHLESGSDSLKNQLLFIINNV